MIPYQLSLLLFDDDYGLAAEAALGSPLGGIARTFSRIGGIAYTRPIIRSNDRTESTISGTASTR